MKHKTDLKNLFLTLSAVVYFAPQFFAHAQLTDGRFDANKVMVARERAEQLKAFAANIQRLNEVNATLNTPDHPRPAPPVETRPVSSQYPTPAPVPQFAPAPPSKPVNRGPKPTVKAKKLTNQAPPTPVPPPPSAALEMATSNSAPILDTTVIDANGVTSPGVADLPPTRKPMGFFNRFRKQKNSTNNLVDINESIPAPMAPEAPVPTSINTEAPLPPSINSEIPQNKVEELEGKIKQLEDSLAALQNMNTPGGIVLPAQGSLDPISQPRAKKSSGLGRLFGRKKTVDTPRESIPIEIARSNGNPYSNQGFNAGPEHSSLFDIHPAAPELPTTEIRDMTGADTLPVPAGANPLLPPKPAANSPGPSKPSSDTSQYWVVSREGSMFTPYRQGTSIPETDYGFEMYSGAAVKVFGLVGSKRKIQIDSGETGVISKDAIRPLSVSEKAVMEKGLSAGKPWYSILDTEPTL